jgi:hypothetical protein
MNGFLSILALAGFVFFLGVIAWFVRHPDLIVILAFGVVLAAIDFWRSFRERRQ